MGLLWNGEIFRLYQHGRIRHLRLPIPNHVVLQGFVIVPVLLIFTSTYNRFPTVDDPADYIPNCRRSYGGYPDTAATPRSIVGYEGIAPLWSHLVNTSVTCTVGTMSGSQYMQIFWAAADALDDSSYSQGAANFSLFLSSSNTSRISTEYTFYHQARPGGDSSFFIRGAWSWRGDLENGKFCYDNTSTDFTAPNMGWSYVAKCGNYIREDDEECDLGPGDVSCVHCICQPGYSCSPAGVVTPLPTVSSVASLTMRSFELGDFTYSLIPSFFTSSFYASPSSGAGSSFNNDYTASYALIQYCEALADTGLKDDCNNYQHYSAFGSLAWRPQDGPTIQAGSAISWSNGTTYTFVSTGSANGFLEDLVRKANNTLPDYGLLRSSNRTATVSSSIYGCKYPDILYIMSYKTTTNQLVVTAYNHTTSVAATGFSIFSTSWVPDGWVVEPQAVLGLNGTSQEIFLFVHSANASQSKAHRLSPELNLLGSTTFSIQLRDPAGTQQIQAASYLPDIDAFGFNIGLYGSWDIDQAAFQLGYPAKYSAGVHRVFTLPQAGDFQTAYRAPRAISNNFCCRNPCYNGYCNSTSGQCACAPNFSGPTCSTYTKLFIPKANTTYTIFRRDPPSVGGRCDNPATGNTTIVLYVNGTQTNTFEPAWALFPYTSSISGSVISAPVPVRVDGLYCGVSETTFPLLPRSSVNSTQYFPFFTLVEVGQVKPNTTVTKTFNGNFFDYRDSLLTDPLLYRIRPVSGNGGFHSVFVKASGLCDVAYSWTPWAPLSTVPALDLNPRFPQLTQSRKRSLYGDCFDNNTVAIGDGFFCNGNITFNPRDNSTGPNEFWLLPLCDENVTLSVTYTFIPSSAPDTNCSSPLAGLTGISCNSTGGGSTFVLSNSTSFLGDLYIPRGTTINLNGYDFKIQGDLYFDGTINTTWVYTSPTKRSVAIDSATIIPSASVGSAGTVTVSGCASISNTQINVVVDADTLPAGTSSSTASTTNVTVNAVVFDCGNATVAGSQTKIVGDDDACVDYNVKSSQASKQKTGLQVLFSFDTTPTGACANSSSTTAPVIGNDLGIGLIAGVIVAIIGGIMVIGVIIYLASPACRSKVTPYRGTTV